MKPKTKCFRLLPTIFVRIPCLAWLLNIPVEDFYELDDEEKLLMRKPRNEQGLVTFSLVENLLEWSMSQRGLFKTHQQINDLYDILNSQ